MDWISLELRTPFDDKKFIISSHQGDYFLKVIQDFNGLWEAHITKLLSQVVKNDSVCIDIGANIGTISVIMAHLSKDGRVYSFEPNPIAYQFLKYNMVQNNLSNVTAFDSAVSNSTGEIDLHLNDQGSAWAIINEKYINENYTMKIKAPAIRIDDWAEQQKIRKIDLIKIDIEGHELSAVQGAANSMAKWKPDLIIEYIKMFDPEAHLYETLRSTYPKIYIITPTGLTEVGDYHSFNQHFSKGAVIVDLYCTFK